LVQRVNSELRKLDTLIETASTAIALLQERRAALISAAVTGKIDLRDLTP
jgi:type I restriction enzyme, S subunit